jgi:polysaccharide deacetylase 2 family uncharacterized protein YibQ
MNSFKNFVIFILSVIILVQSVFLIYLLKRQAAGPKVSKPPAVVQPQRETAPVVLPVEKIPEKPVIGRIVLILDDWGYNLKNRSFVTDNDFHVTLSILPFKSFSTEVARLANNKNKDVIVHMPMEPLNKENYGLEENTLLVTMNKTTVVRTLDAAFQTVPFARGISNHMGSKATEDARLMKIIMEYLKKRGMFFLDSFVTPRTVCRKLAKNAGVAFAARDIFIDNENDAVYIRAQLLKLALKAKRVGVAVGIGHDRVNTVAVLKEAIPRLEAEGYRFVNLSEVVE